MDTRIGYPNEQLAGNSDVDISSPLFATAVGLVMKSISNNTYSADRAQPVIEEAPSRPNVVVTPEPVLKVEAEAEVVKEIKEEPVVENKKPKDPVINENFMDKIFGKVKEFLDNAE
jgi:cell division protein FtsA